MEKLFEGEYKLMEVMWEAGPVNSTRLVELGREKLAWNKSTVLIGPVATNVYLYLQPVVTVAASLLVLAEPVTPLTLAAVALILCGLALSQYRGKKSKEPA